MIEDVAEDMCRIRGINKVEAYRYIEKGTANGRMMSMLEVAEMVKFAIEAPDYMSGSVLESLGGG